MYTVSQLKHDLLFRAKLQPSEVDALLQQPELTSDDAAAVAARQTIDSIMRQSAEPPVLRRAVETFTSQLLRDGATLVQPGPQSQPEEVVETLVSESAPAVDLELPEPETQV